jgi:hypothetical protein
MFAVAARENAANNKTFFKRIPRLIGHAADFANGVYGIVV